MALPVVIDCGGERSAVRTQLQTAAEQIGIARRLHPDDLRALVAAYDASVAARDAAVKDHHRKNPNVSVDESKLPPVAELPRFALVEHDVLDDLADVVEFAITRVGKMAAHAAGCTIRLTENAHRGGDEDTNGWTASISYAVYPELG